MAEYRGAQVIIPENDRGHREYLEQAGQGKLSVQRCDGCGHLRYPVLTMCPDCRSSDWSWEQLSGKGTIYSYYIVPHAINPIFGDFVPYNVSLIELDEARGEYGEGRALRMITNVVDADGRPEPKENLAIGKRVEVTFTDLGDGWALPHFRLSDEPPEGELWQIP